GGVLGDLLQGLLGEDLGVGSGLLNAFRIVRPIRRQRCVAGLAEQVRPVGPATREQPEAVDEDDRGVARGVGRHDLKTLPLGYRRCGRSLTLDRLDSCAHLILLTSWVGDCERRIAPAVRVASALPWEQSTEARWRPF